MNDTVTKKIPEVTLLTDWYLFIYEKTITLHQQGQVSPSGVTTIGKYANLVMEKEMIRLVDSYRRENGQGQV